MPNYQLALQRLQAFNRIVLEDSTLRALLVDGDYNYLQMYQPLILADCMPKYAARTKSDTAPDTHVRVRQLAALAWSVISWVFLVMSRRRVLVYAADKNTDKTLHCDFRMSNLYGYLAARRVGYVEIFHTVFSPGLSHTAAIRRRPAIYQETIDVLYKSVPHQKINTPISDVGEDAELFKILVARYVSRIGLSRFRIRMLRIMLRLSGAKVLLAASDTRNYNELIAACNEVGIETCAFQSGTLSKYDVGYLACGGGAVKPRTLFLETGYWKGELLRLGTYFKPEQLIVGGNMKTDYSAPATSIPKAKSLTVLIPYEIIAPKDEILQAIQALVSCPGVRAAFKVRPDRDKAAQAREYGLEPSENLEVVGNVSELDGVGIVAGTYSTFLYEMIGAQVPVVVLHTSLDYGEGLLVNGLAEQLDTKNVDLCQRLTEIQNTEPATLRSRRDALFGDTVPLAKTLDAILGQFSRR